MIEFYALLSWLLLKPLILPAIAVIAVIVGFACLFAKIGGASKGKLLAIGMIIALVCAVVALLAFLSLFSNALHDWH